MMLRRATLISIALLVVPAAASFAANITELGTAGSYRSYPLANCGQPYSAKIQGACDPPPVNDALSPGKKIQGHLERAQRLLLLARMPQARIAADQAIELDPRNVPALKFRARLALNMQDSETAWHDVNAALKRAPTDSDLLATKAELRSLRQEKGLALQDATAAVQADPKNTDALYLRARMLKQADQLDAAM